LIGGSYAAVRMNRTYRSNGQRGAETPWWGHLDEGHGPSRLRGVALEPLGVGLVGDAQVEIVGQAGDDARHAENRLPNGRTQSASGRIWASHRYLLRSESMCRTAERTGISQV